MAKAIEALFNFDKNNVRVFEKHGTHFIHLQDFLSFLKADTEQAQALINEDFLLKNSLHFGDIADEGLYIEEKGLYILMFNLESPLPDMRIYKLKCYELFYEKMTNRAFIHNEN